MSEAELYGPARQVALVGVGRLQLGLIAPVFSKMGFGLVAVSLRGERGVQRLLDCGLYHVIHAVDSASFEEVRIDEVAILNQAKRERAELEKVACCEVINFGLGSAPDAIKEAGRLLLNIQKLRIESGITHRLLVMCSDNPKGASFGVEAIRDNFMDRIAAEDDPKERRRIWDQAGMHLRFVRSVADKISTRRDVPKKVSLPVKIVCEKYGRLTLDSGFDDYRGIRFELPKGSVVVTNDIERERMYKFYTLSMAHAIACYVGFISINERAPIVEAMKLPEVRDLVGRALEEVAEALSIIQPMKSRDWAADRQTILDRLVNEDIHDEIRRVARDVPRKLLPDDRLLGPILLIYRTRFAVSEPLLTTVAAALLYASRYGHGVPDYEEDADTLELGREIRSAGVHRVISRLLGDEAGRPRLSYLHEHLTNRYMALHEALVRAGR